MNGPDCTLENEKSNSEKESELDGVLKSNRMEEIE